MDLVSQARYLIETEKVYNPDDLFRILYRSNRVHYSRVREAIHIAKGK